MNTFFAPNRLATHAFLDTASLLFFCEEEAPPMVIRKGK